MALSAQMRRLEAKWLAGTDWPQRLDWLEIEGVRGWVGERFVCGFPMMAIVGENGAGKSTVLQAAASAYGPPKNGKPLFASDFFPDTHWDRIRKAEMRFSVRQGLGREIMTRIRKPGDRWRGNPERKDRHVEYIDLRRIQPVAARRGYLKLAKPQNKETSCTEFDKYRLARLSHIMGKNYDLAQMSITEADADREIPVISTNNQKYSGFHQGSGETTMAEFLKSDPPKYSLVLIDEIETSLHPRAQRNLIRDLAELCRERELQIIFTTHSPYIIEELPLSARACIIPGTPKKEIVYGVSPEFAMSKLDDRPHHQVDLFAEDDRSSVLIMEIVSRFMPDKFYLCRTIPYGAASVGKALGIMVAQGRFPDPTCVFIDGDQGQSPGCVTLPGADAPERTIIEGLAKADLRNLANRCARQYPDVVDAVHQALSVRDSHEWVRHIAIKLGLSTDALWQVLCSEWTHRCLAAEDARLLIQPIEDALMGNSSSLIGGAIGPKQRRSRSSADLFG